MKVAFIGLGNMGRPIARNLLHAAVDLTVWNRSAARADELVAAGARRAETVADAARADVVFTMVADDAALEQIVWEGRLVELLPRGAIHVSMSTTSVALAEKLTAAHAARGAGFVSAPVFGRPEVAAAGKLFVVAAGAGAALDRCQPLFDAIGQRTFRIGEEPRLANVVKLSGNFLIASIIESLGEAFALVRKSGVDPHEYLELLTGTLFSAPIFRTYGSLIADRRYQPAGFKMPLGLKDVTLALDAARAATVPMPIASVIRDHMIAALAQGYGELDWAALGELAAVNAGISAESPQRTPRTQRTE
jgi:3-hydroxyisobutyrate dehydrogenase-like beta-hydroxyacid dehydrogenase